MTEQEIIECATCESKVSAHVLASKKYESDDDYPEPYQIYFLKCPICSRVMVGISYHLLFETDKWEWTTLQRLWPKKPKSLDLNIPLGVRKSIKEATKCYNAKAYSACAVMCGRALEALCKNQGSKDWQLGKALKELRDNQIIDGRLFDWGDALRDRRNIGAHANEEDISKDDARDVLDFTIAICEYVYVLADKYKKFKKREEERKILR